MGRKHLVSERFNRISPPRSLVIHAAILILCAVLYVPLSFVAMLWGMVTESLTASSGIAYTVWVYAISIVGFFMFAISAGSIICAEVLFVKKRVKQSYIVRFIPLYVTVVLWGLGFIIEMLA